jgi:DNA-directed RNA polymerase specialized sigma24 family protein
MSPLEARKSLIVRLKNEQDEFAWREFVCSYEGFLIQLARRQGVPERHIPDVTQQILLVIAKSIDGWKDDGNAASFRRWLSTVSRNVAKVHCLCWMCCESLCRSDEDLLPLMHRDWCIAM